MLAIACRASRPACAGGSRNRCIVLRIASMTHALPHRHPRAPLRRCRRHRAAPAAAVRIRRPGAGAREPLDLHRGGAQARRGAGPCAVRRSPGPRQDHAGADRGARARRRLSRDVRPGDCQGRRSRGAADQSRRARRAVHRRNPSPQPGGRGSALSRDGGFSARPDHRRGAGGALGENRTGKVHPGRRHHARGPVDQSAARPFRHSGSA